MIEIKETRVVTMSVNKLILGSGKVGIKCLIVCIFYWGTYWLKTVLGGFHYNWWQVVEGNQMVGRFRDLLG